jgi:hypothetical protein
MRLTSVHCPDCQRLFPECSCQDESSMSPAHDSVLLKMQPIGFQMADGIAKALFPKPTDLDTVNGFDYKHQAWVVRGRYQRCGHPALDHCKCFGRLHAGERPLPNADIH